MTERREWVPLIVAGLTNAVPVAGVVLFGWSLAPLVLVYWFELGVALAFAAVRGLFAQRPPSHPPALLVVGAVRHKRGGISLPWTDRRVQFANVPVVALALVGFGLVWFVAGVIAFAGLEVGGGGTIEDAATTGAGFGMLGAVAGHGVDTVARYFLAGRDERVNVQQALQSAIWPILVVGLALVVCGLVVATGASTILLLAGLVTTKCCFDLAGSYRDRLRAFDERTYLTFGWAFDPPTWNPVDADLDGPVETVRPHRGAVLLDGVIRGWTSDAMTLVAVLAGSGVVLSLLAGDLGPLFVGGVPALALLLLLAVLGAVHDAIRFGWLTYRVGDDGVVGVDRLFGRAQWRVPAWKVERADVERTLADRLVGTETLVVSHDDREIRITNVPDADALVPDRTPDAAAVDATAPDS